MAGLSKVAGRRVRGPTGAGGARLAPTLQRCRARQAALQRAVAHAYSVEEPEDSPDLMRSITDESASVVASPIVRFSATSRSKRRMIFPERVLGSSATTRICRGFAIGPIS